MSPAMAFQEKQNEETGNHQQYQMGVKHLFEKGLKKLPGKYVLPNSDRPEPPLKSRERSMTTTNVTISSKNNLVRLPVIDFAELQGPNRKQILNSLAKACEEYGFFQLVNHGIPNEVVTSTREVCRKFFELPFDERSNYMSSDMRATVRYGTSFNQNRDNVFCWRDFLKLTCNPFPNVLSQWPSSPPELRELAGNYAKETKGLFLKLTEAIVESLGDEEEEGELKEFENGSQLMVVNCYPPCPEPELTLGMPPHSDYGFLTLLLQDDVEGLQINFKDRWVTVQPLADSFVVNVGDHLEIYSNGRYKSVLHRVLVNANKPRISIATLHSVSHNTTIKPSEKLINEDNPRRYKDTDFPTFLKYISSCEPKGKSFLESRKL